MGKVLGVIGRSVLWGKLKLPSGVKLTPKESEHVIGEWSEQKSDIYTNVESMKDLVMEIEKRKSRLVADIPLAKSQFNEVKKQYRETENPLQKRKLASKLVLRSRYAAYLTTSAETLEDTIDRVRDTVEEAAVAYNLLDNRIQDARLYLQMNGCLKLAGKALIDARRQVNVHTPEMEYQNLEFTMEKLQKEVDQSPQDNLIAEADALLAKMEITDGK